MRYDVAVLRSNPLSRDPRATKVSQSLSKRYGVIALGWDRDGFYKRDETVSGSLRIRRFGLRAPYGRAALVAYYPFFWLWVFVSLLASSPSAIHACDLDCLVPSLLFRVFRRVKVVFDSLDMFAMATIPQTNSLLYAAVDSLEKNLASRADAVIVVSPERLALLGHQLPGSAWVIMNCPNDERGHLAPSSLAEDHGAFLLVHAGLVRRDRGIELLSRAVAGVEGARLLLAGTVVDDTLLRLSQGTKYVGLLSYRGALSLEAAADAIPLLYDPQVPINRYANPNRLFDAMMLGIPVITNVCGDIVTREGCGVVVGYDWEGVRQAISLLKDDPTLARSMGERGREAFEREHNWGLMEGRLFRLYDAVLGGTGQRRPEG